MHTWKVWIDGKWTDSVGGQTMAIENPATGKKIAEVVNGSRTDVDRAVGEAKKAFYDGRWTGLARGDRQRMIWRLGELVEQKARNWRAPSRRTPASLSNISAWVWICRQWSIICASFPAALVTRTEMRRASICRIAPPSFAVNPSA